MSPLTQRLIFCKREEIIFEIWYRGIHNSMEVILSVNGKEEKSGKGSRPTAEASYSKT